MIMRVRPKFAPDKMTRWYPLATGMLMLVVCGLVWAICRWIWIVPLRAHYAALLEKHGLREAASRENRQLQRRRETLDVCLEQQSYFSGVWLPEADQAITRDAHFAFIAESARQCGMVPLQFASAADRPMEGVTATSLETTLSGHHGALMCFVRRLDGRSWWYVPDDFVVEAEAADKTRMHPRDPALTVHLVLLVFHASPGVPPAKTPAVPIPVMKDMAMYDQAPGIRAAEKPSRARNPFSPQTSGLPTTWPVNKLRAVGIIRESGVEWALLLAPDGTVIRTQGKHAPGVLYPS